jgi:molybdopterin converting factor subunit 1
LCAIWEPAAREPLQAYLATGKQCPRKFLLSSDPLLLDLPNARALDNVNTPTEFAAASAAIDGSGGQAQPRAASSRKAIRIQYYAILREQAGRSEETLDTSAATAADLYAELSQRHPFKLEARQLKVALNSEFSDWQTPLKHGDTVVFIPPVAGG